METVVKCEKVKEWNGKPIYGIGLSDGRGGESFQLIPVGTPVTELSIEQSNYGLKIRLNKPPQSGGTGYGQKRSGNESFALSYAKDVVIGGKADIKNLFALADKMYDWLEAKKSQTNPVVLASKLPEKTDDLPF